MQLSALVILLTAVVASAKWCPGGAMVCVYGDNKENSCSKNCYRNCDCNQKQIFDYHDFSLKERYCSVVLFNGKVQCRV
ncbi:hypothetical protein PTMSG1_06060 [Pyrenophora teres f. maculata]|nr:hypothetical protein PTMSG1_06060 [Pyrenophora teres f. maculata]